MKHLKTFEAQADQHTEHYVEDLIDEIKEFTEMTLVYLVDNGFVIDVWRVNKRHINIIIMKNHSADNNPNSWENFKWNDLKDSFVPYLVFMDKKYDLVTQNEPDEVMGLCYNHFGWHYYKVDDANNDTLQLEDDFIQGIEIKVKI